MVYYMENIRIVNDYSDVTFNFENKEIVFFRKEHQKYAMGLFDIVIPFSHITAVELYKPSFLCSGKVSIIVDRKRYMSRFGDCNYEATNIDCSKAPDYEKAETALRIMCEDFTNIKIINNGEFDKAEIDFDISRYELQKEYFKKIGSNEEKTKCEEKAVYSINGVRGRHLNVYEDRVVITTKVTLGSILTKNATDGEKTIYYVDCTGVQFKESKFTIGYIQLETSGAIMNNMQDNFFNENSFTFNTTVTSNEHMREVYDYIQKRVKEHKKVQSIRPQQLSAADEIKKFKELLDIGAITEEEYNAKKKQLLEL